MRPGRLGVGNALHAVHAGLEFEPGERSAPADFGDDLLVSAHRAFAGGNHFDLPALLGGVALVHAKQIAGEQGGLVAAGAGADFQDDVAFVHGVLGQQHQPDLLFERRAPLRQLRFFRLGDRAHLRVGGRIGKQRFHPGELGQHRPIGVDRLDHGIELGKFARQANKGVRVERRGQLGLHRGMARRRSASSLVAGSIRAASLALRAKAVIRSRIDTLPTGCSISGRISSSALPQSRSSSIAFTGPTADGVSESER